MDFEKIKQEMLDKKKWVVVGVLHKKNKSKKALQKKKIDLDIKFGKH